MIHGTCDLGERCECRDEQIPLRVFCARFQLQERPIGYLEAFAIANWQRIPESQRTACLASMRQAIPKEVRSGWRAQALRGMRIGSNDLRFHLGVGMQVRNLLRRTLTDGALPEVEYPDGEKYRNWDDFYYGALDELARSEAA